MELSREQCYRAIQSRDPRFDGRFFIGVHTTGVYCRPICPARTPKQRNVSFYPSAAAAEDEGFRACRRCRPETAPGTPAWTGTSATVSRALRLIEEGVLDREGVNNLAERLGMGERQLRRLFREHVGTNPGMVAQTRRSHFARSLLDTTTLPIAQVAHASGFGSVRRFNEVIQRSFGCTPGELRRKRVPSDGKLRLRVPVRRPFAWNPVLEFLGPRTIPGAETIDGDVYWRTVSAAGARGVLSARYDDRDGSIHITMSDSLRPGIASVVGGIRRLFDTDADALGISLELCQDERLRRHLQGKPVTRVPGAFDRFEVSVRAILGQQVSVKGATTLAGRLVERYGEPLSPNGHEESLTHTFPTPERLSRARLESIGMPKQRADTIRGLARAVTSGALDFEVGPSLQATVDALQALPGIGPWTANYLAMRVFREPDAFPAGDLWLRKTLSSSPKPKTEREVERMSTPWRPWRAYVAMTLWHSLGKE